MNQVKPYSVVSFHYWKSYWVTLRPYLMFLSGVSGLVGVALVPEVQNGLFWPVLLAFFLSYGLGQALTDVFQTDTDSISSPYRPLTQGLITRRQVFITSLLGLFLCGLLFFIANPWTLAFSALAVLGLVTYTPLKRRWWGGPFWNSWIVALLPLMGYLCGGNAPTGILQSPVLILLSLSTFFSYAVFVLLGYFKDISADRATHYNTFPVVFGWKPAVLMSFVYLIGCIITSAWALQYAGDKAYVFIPLIFWCAGILSFVWSHIKMWLTSEEFEAHHSIGWVVRGYVLLHIGEALVFKPSFLLLGLIYYFGFELVLALRPEKTQI
jgi:4-hydroxybenzoate polyprenyltransferase